MTSRHRATLAWVALAAVLAPGASRGAQASESPPTNCCHEIYQAGQEMGRLRAISGQAGPAFEQAASLHLRRLGASLQTANEICCKFCEAWAGWQEIQTSLRAQESRLLAPAQRDAAETREAFGEWVESRPGELVQGLNRCGLEEGSPCKWLNLVDCARAYFRLGMELGKAAQALEGTGQDENARPASAWSAREAGLESLETVARLLATLRTGDPLPEAGVEQMRCDYLWRAKTGVESLLAETVGQAERHTNAELAEVAARADRMVRELLLHGQAELGISPCPIGDAHDHENCDLHMEAGP